MKFYKCLFEHFADQVRQYICPPTPPAEAMSTDMLAVQVTWASLPPATADTTLLLWEERFSPVISPSSLELAKPCQTPYGKVRALRKQTLERRSSTEGGGAGCSQRPGPWAGRTAPAGRTSTVTV